MTFKRFKMGYVKINPRFALRTVLKFHKLIPFMEQRSLYRMGFVKIDSQVALWRIKGRNT
ncbi:UNVERIFIED_CONTAM: hypothetical protein NCL1_60174 [Trichonephila clavipes]